ncbi:MAG: arginase [Flavobacteriales bacterium]|nr:arginase [Flavobacteriales bacterium]MCB9173257.1 arginase [Flavobacteriales bacterium]
MKEIKIIKNRSDIGAGTRGSDLGVDAIEIAAINAGSDFFNNHSYVDVPTSNEAVYGKQNTPYGLRIDKVRAVCERLSEYVKDTLIENKFPLVLSGDHSSALGTISGIKCAYPNKRLGVVWIDAHADIHSPYTTPSGNIHGMPLAAALADDNMDKKRNDVSETTRENWEAMKNIGNITPKILHSDLIYFGVRDTESPEDYTIAKNNIKNYKVEEVRYRGMGLCLTEALQKLNHCDLIYISFDVDSMDCDLISKGTGTPVSKGFDQNEIKQIINGMIESGKVACLEVVEVNPCLDNKGNVMAETAFDVLLDVTDKIEKVNIK